MMGIVEHIALVFFAVSRLKLYILLKNTNIIK